MKFYYVNSRNERINLYEYPYFFQEGTLLDYKYSYSRTSGKRMSFTRNIQSDLYERKVKIAIQPDKRLTWEERKNEFAKAINHLCDVLEYDVVNETFGRLYCTTGYYLECNMLISSKSDVVFMDPFMSNEFTVVSVGCKWIKELTKTFEIQDDIYDSGLDYPFDYPFDYTPDGNSYAKWDTEHYAPSDFQLYVYGPCSNPVVTVNGYPYRVFTTLEAGEYFVLDSRDHTITKYLVNGTTSSLYNSRQFTPSVFTQMPAGELAFAWSGDFKFSVKLYLERSEPKWRENPYLLTESGERIKTSKGYLERQSGSGSRAVSSLEALQEIEDDAIVYVVQDDGDYKATYKTVKNEKTANILPENGIALVNVMYFLGCIDSLKVGFEDGKKTGDMIYLTFESGSAEPEVTFVSNNHTGLNGLNLGKNMTFELIGLWNGTKWMFAKSEVLNE